MTSQRTLTRVWILLVAITVGSWSLAPAHITHAIDPSPALTALVLALAFVKPRLIIQHFMEVHTGPRWLKRATDAWLMVLIAAVFVIYLF